MLKWTKDGGIEKSKRPMKNICLVKDEDDMYQNNIEKSAYNASLHHDENSWEWMTKINNESFNECNKREDTDKKMAERQMFSQISLNPYLTNNNYVNDIVVRDSFLKPVSTTLEREKEGKKDEG
jgi:hypothetical protein